MVKPQRYWATLRQENPKAWVGSMVDFAIEVRGRDMHEALANVQRAFGLLMREHLERDEELPTPGGGNLLAGPGDPNNVIAAIDWRPEKDLVRVRVSVVMTAGERYRLDVHAERLGISTAEFLRQAGLAAVDAADKK